MRVHCPCLQEAEAAGNPLAWEELLKQVSLPGDDPKLKEPVEVEPDRQAMALLTGRVAAAFPWVVASSVVDAVKFFDKVKNVSTRQTHQENDPEFLVCVPLTSDRLTLFCIYRSW